MKRLTVSYPEFLEAVINDGIVAAEADYPDYPGEEKDPDRQANITMKRHGSVAGFEACRDLSPEELKLLHLEALHNNQEAFQEESSDYWYWRCYSLEIEWVCNVVSSMLVQLRKPGIVPTTVRGVFKATEILSNLNSQ